VSNRREEARHLREAGESLKTIADTVGAAVSSVSRWTADIVLSEAQMTALEHRAAPKRARGLKAAHHASMAAAVHRSNAARTAGASEPLTPGKMLLLGLYWGEGTKTRKNISVSNTDPAMIVTVVHLLVTELQLPRERITFSAQVQRTDMVAPAKKFWAHLLGVSEDAVPVYVLGRVGRHQKDKHPHGTLMLRVTTPGTLLPRLLGWVDQVVKPLGVNTSWPA
jgi:hypothetical protein